MEPVRPLEADPAPEEFLKRGLYGGSTREAKNSWFPVYCSLILAGVEDSRILEIRRILIDIYQVSGLRGMATTVKRWGKATRVILEANPRTLVRGRKDYQAGYAKSMKNWARLVNARNLAPSGTHELMVKAQGEREIPPFLISQGLILALLPDPSRTLLERLVILSNLGRTQPSPGKEEIQKGLRAFKQLVETPPRHPLRVRTFVRKCFERFRGKGVDRVSHWSVTGHASLEYTRRRGGKTQEIIDKVLHEFMHLPITAICPTRPEEVLVDATGTEAIDPEFWDPAAKIGEVVYPGLCSDREISADARLGHIGFLWAWWTLKTEGELALDSNESFHGLFPKSTKPQYSVVWCNLLARVEALAEEGWKCRVITITSMAAVVLGHVARHILDPVLVSDDLIRIGLRDKVKLWSLLRRIRVPPGHADSVDLTTATDGPTRIVVQDVLHGMLDGIRHPLNDFLRLTAEIACATREFSGDIVPVRHERGIMMGEPLSGVFLNAMSFAVRSLTAPLLQAYPELAEPGWSNEQCDEFITRNVASLQEFLDRGAVPQDDRLSSQSGDDVIAFSCGGYGSAMRTAYRIFELIPSENTWYESTRYALFTEEAALKVGDGQGWKFVDSIKPRTFVPASSDPDSVPILGKLSLMTSYLRYIVEDYGTEDERYVKAVRLADLLIRQDMRVLKPILRDNLAVGLPRSLGGIMHPIGLQRGYLSSLTPEIRNGIWRYVSRPPLEILRQEFLAEDPERGADPEILAALVSGFFDVIEDYDIKTLEEVKLQFVPEEDRRFAYKVAQCAKAAGLKSIQDCLSEIVRQCTFLALLQGARRARPRPMQQVRRSAERIRLCPGPAVIPTEAQALWNSTDVSKFLANARTSLYLPKAAISDYLASLDFPSMRVEFHTYRA